MPVSSAVLAALRARLPRERAHQRPREREESCIALIEKFIRRAERVCVLFTWSYLERLWCVAGPSRLVCPSKVCVRLRVLTLAQRSVKRALDICRHRLDE